MVKRRETGEHGRRGEDWWNNDEIKLFYRCTAKRNLKGQVE